MIRLTLALLATMFVTFMIAGADRGQVRHGLSAETQSPQTITAPAPQDEPVAVVYVPSQPVIAAPQIVVVPAPEPAVQVTPLAAPERLVRFIAVNMANVREGPSKDFAVVEKLTRGEAVTILAASDDPDGWTLITIEGDGLEGYVSNALLTDQP